MLKFQLKEFAKNAIKRVSKREKQYPMGVIKISYTQNVNEIFLEGPSVGGGGGGGGGPLSILHGMNNWLKVFDPWVSGCNSVGLCCSNRWSCCHVGR